MENSDSALRAAFKVIPKGSVDRARSKLASLHGVSKNTIYSWETQRHPGDFKSIMITEDFFEARSIELTRFDLRPDIWGRDDLEGFLNKTPLRCVKVKHD